MTEALRTNRMRTDAGRGVSLLGMTSLVPAGAAEPEPWAPHRVTGSRSVWLRTFLALVAVVSAANGGAPWTAKTGSDQRVVETTGTALVGDLRVNSFLSLSCNRTGVPVAWLDYTVSDSDTVMKSFDLSSFEGPDAPAQSQQLVSIELAGGNAPRALRAHASGWLSAEHTGGFGFGIGGQPRESEKLSKLITQMTREGTVLRIRITSLDKPHRTIVSEFPLAGSREALTTLATFCR